MNVREYYNKTTQTRHSDKVEIQMYEIFERLKDVYRITDNQAKQLMEWEINEEINAVVPILSNIEKVKGLVKEGNAVVLISDMYLPKAIIKKMLNRVDEQLTALPIYVSCDYGFQKMTRFLYYEVYKSFKPFYQFGKWIHYGDNPSSDRGAAQKLGITPVLVNKVVFSDIEQEVVAGINNYDSYIFSAICARLLDDVKKKFINAEFVIDIVGATLIPYVDLVLRDALDRGFETLYFIARDGFFLKEIADRLVSINGWKIDTKYIYASRRTWRVQSYFDKVDETFWITQGGNFNDIHSKEYMLKALYIDEDTFNRICPHINLDSIDWTSGQPGRIVASIVRKSEEYNNYLLSKAKELRKLTCMYLEQEVDWNKKIAFVEYWGRGYNQNCMTKLLSYISGDEKISHFYYARSILPSNYNNKRYDMTDIDVNISLFEPVFANMPYTSIEEYEDKNGRIEPIIYSNNYFDKSLYDAMEAILPIMASEYAKAGFVRPKEFSHSLFDFLLNYISKNRHKEIISEGIGGLRYSMSMYGKIEEYAPAYSMHDLEDFDKGKARGDDTLSIQMSYGRASDVVKKKYDSMYQVKAGEDPFKSPKLTKFEINKNSDFKKKFEDVYARAEKCNQMYYDACKNSLVFNKIVVVSTSKDYSRDSLYSLKKVFCNNKRIHVEWMTSSRPQELDFDFIQQIVSAKYIIVDGNAPQLIKIKYRNETTCISLLDRGFRLYNFGRNEIVRLNNQYQYDVFMHTRMPNVIESTSVDCIENNGYTMDLEMALKIHGACVTDVLFDSEYKKQSMEKIHRIAPESVGKKLICYLPMPRNRKKCGNWLELMDMQYLADKLSDDYYMLLDFRCNNKLADNCDNVIEISGFSRNMSKERISLRNMLAVADIVIGDYRDTFFEAALLGVPVYSTAVDMEEIQSKSLNLGHDLNFMYPFPVVRNEEEFLYELSVADSYNYSTCRNFANKYLIGCDGMSAERILDYINTSNEELDVV